MAATTVYRENAVFSGESKVWKFLVLLTFINVAFACVGDQFKPWSYRGGINGPRSWRRNYRECGGWRQSPINIETEMVSLNPRLTPLTMVNYDIPLGMATVENNGYTVKVHPQDLYPRYIHVEGSRFYLQEIHFHWGSIDHRGSEHEINGKVAAMEVHFVHVNSTGEIAVVAVMLTDRENAYLPELEPLIDILPYIRYSGEKRTLRGTPLMLDRLLPSNPCTFYRYHGSLTTPPCAEHVIWSICKRPVDIGEKQLFWRNRLYSTPSTLMGNMQCDLVDNYRPVQSLNGRRVYSSRRV